MKSPRGNSGGRGPTGSAAARYEVLERVGEGTLFVVYRVRDRKTGDILALKALKASFVRHARFAAALAETSARAAPLQHPHIARLAETGQEEGTFFLVSEWLPGGSLELRLRQAPLDRSTILLATRQIAEALHFMHDAGLAHGDLRPRQLLFAGNGDLKLTDSGFSEAFAAAGLALTDVEHDAAFYMAPERFDGQAPAPASDLYAVGAIVYRMLTGRVPFDGPSPLAIATRHRRDVPLRPSQFNPNCPPDLEAIALRLLEKDPRSRPLSASQLLRELAPSSTHNSANRIAAARASSTAATSSAPSRPIRNAVTPISTPISTPDITTPTATAAAAASTSAVSAAGVTAAAGAATVAAGAISGVAAAPTAAAPTATAPTATGAATMPLPVTAPPAPDDTAPSQDIDADAAQTRNLSAPPVDADAAAGSLPRRRQRTAPLGTTADPLPGINTDQLERRRHRRREALGAFLALFWMLVVGALLGGIVYGAYYFWMKELPKEVPVPEYRWRSQSEAEKVLAKRGLRLRVSKEIYDRKHPAGTVLGGEVPPGKVVRTGREVMVTISRGEEWIKMYDFTELTPERARQIIVQHGMRLGQVSEQFHDRVPRGYICGQFPEPGSPFRRSEPINLIVSRGPQPAEQAPATAPLLPPPESDIDPVDETDDRPAFTEDTGDDEMLVSRAIAVRVVIPTNNAKQEVRIVVRDADGERTVTRETHAAGEVVNKTVQVKRRQGTTALLRIYVGGKLLREQQI